MGDKQLAQDLIDRISAELSVYFDKKLSKPISLSFKENQPEHNRQWPTGWNPTEKEHFILGIHDDFDLAKSWWSLDGVDRAVLRRASLAQKYIIALTHEMTHIYMYPTPLVAWFQEAIAMNIGKEVAIKIDPALDKFYPLEFPVVDPRELRDYPYEVISNDMDALKKLQLSAMGLAKNLSQESLLRWVSSNSSEGYNPLQDDRDPDEVETQLIESIPKE